MHEGPLRPMTVPLPSDPQASRGQPPSLASRLSRRRLLGRGLRGSALLVGAGALLSGGLGSLLAPGPLQAGPRKGPAVVRVGYQKAGTVLVSLKAKKGLEKSLAPAGSKVEWSEFTAGLPMVEALNAGAIDLAYVGEAPPIFAQAAANSLTRYVAFDPFGPRGEGIVVQKDSGINKLADLRGKKIAVQKGSNTHYLLIKALQAAKLKPSQVEIVFLKPSDARAAFERKDVSAWVIWDPYLAAAEAGAGARLLADARGLAPNRGYYLASSNFIASHPDTLRTVLATIKKEAAAVGADPEGTANLLAPALGINAKVLAVAERRRKHDAIPISAKVIEQQQDVADTFAELQLIPRPVKVKEAVWKWN